MEMKKMFKAAAFILVVMLVLTGCASNSGSTSSEEDTSDQEVTYPTKAIELIVPAGAGGDTDMNARLFGKYLEKELGQPVVVVNVGGSGGTVGTRRVKDAKADGHTVLFFHPEILVPYVAGMVDYHIDAFEIAGIGVVDNTTVLATHKDSPYNSLSELVEDAKKNPGKIDFGMQTGGYPHIVGLAVEDAAGIELNMTDVGGNADKTVALMAGRTDFINTQYGLTKDYFESGDFKQLGLLSKERNPLMPDIPTALEQGFDIVMDKFFFFGMPKGTSEDIVNKFSAAMEKVTQNPDYQKEAENIFVTPTYMNPKEATNYIMEYHDRFMKFQEQMKGN